MSGHGSKLGQKREAAIAALLVCPTQEQAAEKAGIGVATLRRWLAQPDFRRAYRDARRQLVESALGILQRAATHAVAALVRNLTCKVPAAEIRAAQVILEQAVRGVETADLIERVEALEADRKGGRKR